jgi:Mg2+/Co2+ transporter CorB
MESCLLISWAGLRGWLRKHYPPPLGTKLSILQSKVLLYINDYNNLQSKVLLYINNYNKISSMVVDEYGTYSI